jgi:hypothetical protein
MPDTTCYMSISLDGFVRTGSEPRESAGKRGRKVNGWHLGDGRANDADASLGSGERLFDGVESLGLEPVEVLHSPLATHIRYRRAE